METVCTRLSVGLHERSSSARSGGAVRAKRPSISAAILGWYWKTATWRGCGLGLGLAFGSGLSVGVRGKGAWEGGACEESSLTT